MAKQLPDVQGVFPSMRIFFVGSYLPRNCGVATFTHDLAHAIGGEIGDPCFRIVAMNNQPKGYDYPEEVAFEINQNRIHDYRLATDYVNLSGADLVCLQHEFGIFGGPEGIYVNHFLGNLKKPVVTTLHTIMSEPDEGYLKALQEVAKLSECLVVMSHQGERLLREVYGVPEGKIHFIHHGVPDVPFIDPNYYKDQFHVEGRLVLLTSGLLNPNKGIETVLEALPEVVERVPNIVYIVLGATHPAVKTAHGEEYRLSLQRKVVKLGLEQYVFFHNRFIELQELCEFIGACDIYVTPYLSQEQITSGTLAYAVGMGKAVISTPYWYAQEVLQDGRGRLFEFGDVQGFTRSIIDLIQNEVDRHHMRKRAYELGRQMTWKNVARAYLETFRQILESFHGKPETELLQARFLPQDPLPEIKLDHIFRLTDDTGIIQHSTYGIPDRRFGYSTDDVARALVVVLMAYHQLREENLLDLANAYLAFLRYAQLDNGRFHNLMNYARQFTDVEGSENTWGRAIWGLGYAVHRGPTKGFRDLARELFESATVNLEMQHPMSKAYSIVGLYHFLQRYSGARGIRRLLRNLTEELVETYHNTQRDGWRWFTEAVTYGNARMPQALLLAYKALGNQEYRRIALETLDFLTEVTFNGEYFDFVGNDKWYEKGKGKAFFDQQPIDPGYTVETYVLAHEITKQNHYLELARVAFEWFLGRNCLGISLYDFATNACYDGLTQHGRNANQGAESTISFLLANLTLSHQLVLKSLVKESILPTRKKQKSSKISKRL